MKPFGVLAFFFSLAWLFLGASSIWYCIVLKMAFDFQNECLNKDSEACRARKDEKEETPEDSKDLDKKGPLPPASIPFIVSPSVDSQETVEEISKEKDTEHSESPPVDVHKAPQIDVQKTPPVDVHKAPQIDVQKTPPVEAHKDPQIDVQKVLPKPATEKVPALGPNAKEPVITKEAVKSSRVVAVPEPNAEKKVDTTPPKVFQATPVPKQVPVTVEAVPVDLHTKDTVSKPVIAVDDPPDLKSPKVKVQDPPTPWPHTIKKLYDIRPSGFDEDWE